MSFTVYGLRLRGATEVRYVGFTGHTPNSRLACLTREARLYGRRPTDGFGGWLLDNEGEIEAVELAGAATKTEAHEKERLVVGVCIMLNHRLFNRWLVPAGKRIAA